MLLLLVDTVIGCLFPRCIANGAVDEPHAAVDAEVTNIEHS